ncbi:MAG: GNAT family N-acetyltransferase [Neisseriaceae bacterium]|nr:GNAT family N-acetyltransferase [Neisseriaceae bacterium]
MMNIRKFAYGDANKLLEIFLSAVHETASKDYTQEQINAWAPWDLDIQAWFEHMQKLRPYVALVNDEIVGYADLQLDGYIDHFFVSSCHARQGIGTQLMMHICEEAKRQGINELTSDVSKTAEPFFLLHNFRVIERRFPVRRGVMLENSLMMRSFE